MENNLAEITKNGRALFLAYDHGLEHGPTDFTDTSVDPARIMEIAESGFFTGLIVQKGIAEKYYEKTKNKAPLILKLNGRTNLEKDDDPYSPQICSVKEAISLGASAVGYTVYVGSFYESQMLGEIAKIEEEAESHGLPLIAWMYPRGKAVAGKENNKETLAYAARIGLEIGAEMVKIPYSGDPDSFRWVVQAAGKVKVIAAGGKKENEEDFLREAQEIMLAGAAGMAVGRNIWQTQQPLVMARRLNEIIFTDKA